MQGTMLSGYINQIMQFLFLNTVPAVPFPVVSVTEKGLGAPSVGIDISAHIITPSPSITVYGNSEKPMYMGARMNNRRD